ncbi:MAG: protoporphyrinogen oxidase HemJ [Xanthomonadaceae bacterium]|nr:protoporphyrinogen oxidase HemJ [Xanthomonadaceae bacterium]
MLWLKSFHVIFMVSWFAALFYLPRLFVYHCDVTAETEHTRFCIMERKLYNIGLIAMIGTWVFAVALLAANPGYFQSGGWLHLKILLAVILSGYYGWLKGLTRKFAAKANTRSHKFYRLINEIPAVLLVAMVILVIVKPF